MRALVIVRDEIKCYEIESFYVDGSNMVLNPKGFEQLVVYDIPHISYVLMQFLITGYTDLTDYKCNYFVYHNKNSADLDVDDFFIRERELGYER